MGEDGRLVQVYFLMGRSQGSRNRILWLDNTGVWTRVADPQKETGDPGLTIYPALMTQGDYFVVSNGRQTQAIADGLRLGINPYAVLEDWDYEPDAPNFTPRISAVQNVKNPAQPLVSIIRRAAGGGVERFRSEADVCRGVGLCVTTYEGDGTPLPSFVGAPYLLPLVGNDTEIFETYRDMVPADKSIAFAVVSSCGRVTTTTIRNQHKDLWAFA
jgi:hypothetical protein